MKRCPDALWEDLARADDTATFFQTPAWHKLAAEHLGAESHPLLFEFPRGPVCLPLLRDRRWGRWRWFSPFGTYTAPLCPYVLDPDERADIAAALKPHSLQLAGSPWTRNPIAVGRQVPSSTRFIPLDAVDPAQPMARWKEDQRRRARSAARRGLTVREVGASGDPSATDADWDAYLGLYAQSLTRWGRRASSRYSPAFFAGLRALSAFGHVKLWVAGRGNRVGAGFIACYHHTHAALWHGAADTEFFREGANQLLYLAIQQDAMERGCTRFDLLPSGGHQRVEDFKARFGSEQRTYSGSINRPGLIGLLSDARARITRGT